MENGKRKPRSDFSYLSLSAVKRNFYLCSQLQKEFAAKEKLEIVLSAPVPAFTFQFRSPWLHKNRCFTASFLFEKFIDFCYTKIRICRE